MTIGFDLDGVFIDKPPLVPKWLIERLYRSSSKTLTYRIPSKPEQVVRKLTHIPFLRPPIRKNIAHILEHQELRSSFFLITSRFSFLRKETTALLKKNNLDSCFSKIIINSQDMQPHVYKHKMLRRFKIVRYVDDDLPLLMYLADRNPSVTFYYLNDIHNKNLHENIIAITDLSDIFR